jgi:hypothetical protein
MRREATYFISILLLLFLTVTATGQNRPSYEVERLSINSGVFSDIAPVIYSDGILFCSGRKSSVAKDNRTWDNGRSYDIYFAAKKDDGMFRNPGIFSRELASMISEGPLCFTPDGNNVYFTRNLEQGKAARKKKNKNLNGIFIADKQGNNWVNIRPFEYNDPDFNVGHPAISSDGMYLFFSSDMPGGMGKSDIYYCEWINNSWSKPVNAAALNTSGAEIYLNYHPSGRLYFSSDRQPARSGPFAGLNIYYSTFYQNELTEPIMLGEPINSTADDFALTAYPDGQSGYFSSSRKRSDDIYSFNSIVIRKDDCKPQAENSFCYEFYEVNAVRFDSIPFEFEWDFGDGKKAMGVRADHCFDGPGTYIVSLNSVNLVTREVQKNEVSYELEVKLIEQPYITGPDTLRVGETALFESKETYLPGWIINDYYWNFGDETVAGGDNVTKSFLQSGTYEMQLIVSTEPDRNDVVREACVVKRVVVVKSP